jgi:hypothetical protein
VAVALLFSSKINDELRRCLLCLTSGVLGSATSAFISSLDRRAHGWEIGGVKIPPGEGERFNEKIVPFFLGRPLLGFLVGLLVYTAGMAEVLFKPEGTTDPAKSVYRLVFYSLLAGLFAKSLIEKLKAIFDYVFGARQKSFGWLDMHRRPIREHFGDALHHLGRVVAGTDHGVRAHLGRVLQHEVESFGAGLLA